MSFALHLIAILCGLGLPACLPKKYLSFNNSESFFLDFCLITIFLVISVFLVFFRSKIIGFWALRNNSLDTFFKSSVTFFFSGMCVFFLAYNFSCWRLSEIVKEQLPDHLIGEDLLVEGVVTDLPKQNDGIQSFYFYLTNIDSANQEINANAITQWGVNKKIRLSWRHNINIIPGQRWCFKLRLKPPRGTVNWKGFDYHAWLLAKNLRANGYVKEGFYPGKDNCLTDADFIQSNPLSKLAQFEIILSTFRFNISKHIDGQSEKLEFSRIFKALLVGDKRDLSVTDWETFSNTGTVHLMAISGLHIGLIALIVFSILNLIFRLHTLLFGFSCSSYSVFAIVGSVVVSLIYACLAGLSIPTLRAVLLIAILSIARIMGLKTSFVISLLLVACFIALFDPFAFLQQGFWLSFIAVYSLIYWFSERTKSTFVSVFGYIRSLFQTQYVAFIGLFFMSLFWGLKTPLVSVLANFLAVPVISFLVLPIILFGLGCSILFEWLANDVFLLADSLFGFLFAWLKYLEQVEVVDLKSFVSFEPTVINILLGLFSTVLLLSPKGMQYRFLGFVIVCVLLVSNSKSSKIFLSMDVLDVGQGLSIVLNEQIDEKNTQLLNVKKNQSLLSKDNDYTLVYDTGAKYSDSFDIGSRILVPYLRMSNINNVDLLVLSHLDNDHAGGFEGLMNNMPVSGVLTGQKDQLQSRLNGHLDNLIKIPLRSREKNNLLSVAHNPSYVSSCDSQSHFWEKEQAVGSRLKIKTLWPNSDFENKQMIKKSFLSKDNNHSCVLLIQYGEYSLLLMGDAELQVEKYLLDQYLMDQSTLPQNIDVLIAGHHGSNTSSTKRFIEHIRPKYVVFSAGYRNRYHHPSKKVLERFNKTEAILLNTADHGQVRFLINSDGLSVSLERQRQNRRWH